MKKKKDSQIIPHQTTGKAIDAESTIELSEPNDAKAFFAEVKNRLRNIKRWKEYAGTLSARFQLVDENGVEVLRNGDKGDYIKIDIPGPGSQTGAGYDWVKIEEIEDTASPDSERFAFRVRPSANPQGSRDDVAHFYSNESTSSFIVERNGNKVTASVHDRNTKPNTEANTPADKIRDVVVGAAGVATFSKIQWKKLTDGLVNQKS